MSPDSDERKREIERLLNEEFVKKKEKGEKGFFRRHLLVILALVIAGIFNTLTLLVILGVI